ncbi:MAG: hypothetical protein SOX54_05105, partial [Prevotella sp.]|nr:hypothetical protein [Prevotella sp.]
MEELEFYKEWCLIMYDFTYNCSIRSENDESLREEYRRDFENIKNKIIEFYNNGNLRMLKRWFKYA